MVKHIRRDSRDVLGSLSIGGFMVESHGAIVVGGGIAGLLAGAALADGSRSVLILDRDTLPTNPEPRRSAHQGAQVHLMLDRGRQAVEALLPGLFDEVMADGGRAHDFGEARWYHSGDFKASCETGYLMRIQSRPLLEHHIRRRVRSLPRVELRDESKVTALRVEAGRVVGVTAEDASGQREIAAPLVVDASGRASRAM